MGAAENGRGRLAGRVALVTGASRGIGRAVARRFAEEGADIIAVARTQGALEELDDELRGLGRQAILVPGDLQNGAIIDQIGAAVFQRFGRLDVLVSNAAQLGGLSPMGHFEPKVFDKVVATNITATYRLIRSLDPLLRQSEAGRAIFVTAAQAHGVHPYWGAYAASKAAIEAMVRCYAGELNLTRVKVNLLDPGITRTRLRAEAFPGEPGDSLKGPEAVTDAFVDLAEAACVRHGELVQA